ncbi:MAG: response regulator transcription factor [Gammaproteobacteria bacterium]|jgi:two-component system KDP operon response regulator KdpE|uniref:response regulator transcription factor n=1 Tax=Marinomonas TaxID=28253 RepID=UPI000C1E3372|nr:MULTISPECIES: response regulator transcription factor [unclassified Marinomonas]MBU1294240.1 response regulator transcription factor [Gammaproteobacteria bacterium]MBU1466201.1 response regulator transcription factor [Gammaproteobacteria bacterium]MBU2022782.1 response regulator transcription factor [Gammaproteobacteria bacterium]MBU2240774.1 response regulator transcription factor [Gammaproteobacteria bacterium]MBU2318241.1 response regulator transcription factor [Gammaproteobacteria bacte
MTPYKILVVDDEPQIHTFIRISLAAEGFEYLGAESIAAAKQVIEQDSPHLLILDLGLPDGDGMDLVNYVRATSNTPILILTARDEEDEKIRLLEAGANDYLSKPFGIRELIARVKVLLRDLVNTHSSADVLEIQDIKLEISTNQAWLQGSPLALTKKEFAFLRMLMTTPDKLVMQEELLAKIWGVTHTRDSHYLRILVSQLRKKLNDNANDQRVIKTEPGLGYRLLSDR